MFHTWNNYKQSNLLRLNILYINTLYLYIYNFICVRFCLYLCV
nr:MAG TPA: hypothetical protein [Caudoviricetes sp.]